MPKPNVKIKKQTIEQLEKYELPILSSIHDRISYGSSFLNRGVRLIGVINVVCFPKFWNVIPLNEIPFPIIILSHNFYLFLMF